MTTVAKVLPGAVVFAESGLFAVKTVFPHAANDTAHHRTKRTNEELC
jgi:hypothetical protein